MSLELSLPPPLLLLSISHIHTLAYWVCIPCPGAPGALFCPGWVPGGKWRVLGVPGGKQGGSRDQPDLPSGGTFTHNQSVRRTHALSLKKDIICFVKKQLEILFDL